MKVKEMGTWIDEKTRYWHWCEECKNPSWFHTFTNKYDGYTYYFCNTRTVETVGWWPFKREVETICNNEKHTMENDDYSEGEHESAVPLKIECVEVTA